MMFVQHDIEAEFIGGAPFIEALMIDVRAFPGVVMLGRQRYPEGGVAVRIGEMRIGGFAEIPGAKNLLPIL